MRHKAEWTKLSDYWGGSLVAGFNLKETGTTHWTSKNTGATNESGFSALPGGNRESNGNFSTALGIHGDWWSSTPLDNLDAWSLGMGFYMPGVASMSNKNKASGFSVRCVMDPETTIDLPTLITLNVTDITSTSVAVSGDIKSDGGATVTARGVCCSSWHTPNISDSLTSEGSGTGAFTSSVKGLRPHTTYNVRAYATNSRGTGYGKQVSFITALPVGQKGTVTDIDGNSYNTTTIGTQVWMTENLKTTKYNDGTAIPLVVDNTTWSNLTTPGYCWYNNDAATYKAIYGTLYNWYVVNTGKLCPNGWHVPTDSEWTTLTTFLSGESDACGKLKEAGTTHWNNPNTGATNESGFTALPGGERSHGTFYDIGQYGYWWSNSVSVKIENTALRLMLPYNSNNIFISSTGKKEGFTVRCVKD